MSGMPMAPQQTMFVDQTTTATEIYHQTVPAASNNGSGQAPGVAGIAQHRQQSIYQQPPPSLPQISQEASLQQQDGSLSSWLYNATSGSIHNSSAPMPLPPGMEIILGNTKYTIRYQSYEMTREKAAVYIEKCTGTPFARLSSPPDPAAPGASIRQQRLQRQHQHQNPLQSGQRGVDDAIRNAAAMSTANAPAESQHNRQQGGFSSLPPPPPSPSTAGPPPSLGDQRVTTAVPPQHQILGAEPSPAASISDAVHRERHPQPRNHMHTLAAAASGLSPPPIQLLQPARGVIQQQQQHQSSEYVLPPLQQGTHTTTKLEQQSSPSQGYFWEDGVWKVWQAGNNNERAGQRGAPAPIDDGKMPAPILVVGPAPAPMVGQRTSKQYHPPPHYSQQQEPQAQQHIVAYSVQAQQHQPFPQQQHQPMRSTPLPLPPQQNSNDGRYTNYPQQPQYQPPLQVVATPGSGVHDSTSYLLAQQQQPPSQQQQYQQQYEYQYYTPPPT